MNQPLWSLACLFSLATLAALSSDMITVARHKQIEHANEEDAATGARHQRNFLFRKARHVHVAAAPSEPSPSIDIPPPRAAAAPLSGDLAAVKNAIHLVRKAKSCEATAIKKTNHDPAPQKPVARFSLAHPAT